MSTKATGCGCGTRKTVEPDKAGTTVSPTLQQEQTKAPASTKSECCGIATAVKEVQPESGCCGS